MKNKSLVIVLASLIDRIQTGCGRIADKGRREAFLSHAEDELERVSQCYLPSGSGFDAGTQVLIDECRDDRLVLQTAFHHLSAEGHYTRWTHHKVVVAPTWTGFSVRVGGQDYNGIREYISDTFTSALTDLVEHNPIPKEFRVQEVANG